jgi:anti-anti-sigma factor
MARPSEIVVEKTPTVWVLGLPGEHDLATVDVLSARTDAALQAGANVVVDLTETTFIDSIMVGAIFAGFRSATKEGRSFLVVSPTGRSSRRIIELVSMEDVVPVYETIREALAALGGGSESPSS